MAKKKLGEVTAGDKEAQEVIEKVKDLVAKKHDGDYHKAFGHYDSSGGGDLDCRELIQLLDDCDVGNWLTRGMYAKGIITALDANKDGRISFEELQTALEAE